MGIEAWRWIAAVKKGELTADDEGKEFIRYIERELLNIAMAENWRMEDRAAYIERLTYEFIERVLDDNFRPHWRNLPTADAQRLARNDFYKEFLSTVKKRYVESRKAPVCYSAEMPGCSINDEGEDFYELEPVSVNWHRASPDAARRGDTDDSHFFTWDDLTWQTLKRCLAEFRACEWPAEWRRNDKHIAAHVLLWYERNPPEADLKNYELAEVLGLASAAEASRQLAEARRCFRSAPESPTDGVPISVEWLYWQGLLAVLRRRDT
jgi:hypothetical protein